MSLTQQTMIAAVTAAILVGSLAFADVAPQKATEPPSTLADTGNEVKATDTPLSSLRCWQYGKLLFEQNGLVDNKPDKRQPMQVFSDNDRAGGRKLYLFETGTATCLYETTESTQ